jgi:hypothetical protein
MLPLRDIVHKILVWRCNVSDSTDDDDIDARRLPTARGPVVDNRTKNRFELAVDGGLAFLLYERTNDAMTLIHTEVPEAARGHHTGGALVEAALETARSAGLRVVALCPFARAYLRKHPPAG